MSKELSKSAQTRININTRDVYKILTKNYSNENWFRKNYFFNILTQNFLVVLLKFMEHFIKDLTEYSNLSELLYFAYEIRS